MKRAFFPLVLLIFTASGFAGLIYESVWSHYLKLFLGHAAYAQTLVLAIFMGGMALGSWLCSRYSSRWRNLLLGYAAAEGAIGLTALIFHRVFVGVTDLAYDGIMPALGSPFAVDAFKWGLSAALILPQSVLLGMTFPLMSVGLIRTHPDRAGGTIAMLYFTNSLGAAAGVLASGFVLIGWVIATIERLTGQKAEIDRQPARAGDQQHTRANIGRAQRVLGYNPTTPLEEGLRRQTQWQAGLLRADVGAGGSACS